VRVAAGSLREIHYLCALAPLRSFLPTAMGSLREIHDARARRPTRLSLRANRMPDACGYWSTALMVLSPEGWNIHCRGRRPR
jgi:hypothetical protein